MKTSFNLIGLTPDEYKTKGKEMKIAYNFHHAHFGDYLLAVTGNRICGLILIQNRDREEAVEELKNLWPESGIIKNPTATIKFANQIKADIKNKKNNRYNFFVKGTAFQIKVWQALLNIPFGTVISYTDVAAMIGRPKSVRAAANAIGKNPIAILVPCHRVISKSGGIGGYRWGTECKKALISRER